MHRPAAVRDDAGAGARRRVERRRVLGRGVRGRGGLRGRAPGRATLGGRDRRRSPVREGCRAECSRDYRSTSRRTSSARFAPGWQSRAGRRDAQPGRAAVRLPVGPCLAEQLLLPLAQAGGGSFRTVRLSRHTLTNVEVIRRFLDVDVRVTEIGADVVEVRVGSGGGRA
ncbi:MAG: hypothetical protein HY905_17210 [Deltaproteobacteria bacterium]|nr:hypothetical protein [Deltaproteobacteria bacterium]